MTTWQPRTLLIAALVAITVQLAAAQTFTYSKGWTNGKRSGEDPAVYKAGGGHENSLETAARSLRGSRWSADQHRLLQNGRSTSMKNLEDRMAALESIFLNLMTSVSVPPKDAGPLLEKHASAPTDYYAD